MSTATNETAGPTGEALEAQLAAQRVVARRSLRSVLGVSPDEEDLVQDVLARLVVRLRQPGEVALSPWTWRVAHNVAVDHLRARRATPMDPVLLDREVGDGLDDEVIASELAAAVNDGLARLPHRQRDALVAQAGLDGGRGGHAIVAAELGVTPKAAESILARARHSLRRELGEWVAVGAFAGWVVRVLRRVPKPKSLAVRAALIATVAVGGAAAVVVVTASPRPARAPAPHAPVPAAGPRVRQSGRSGLAPPGENITHVTVPALRVPGVTVPSVAVPGVTVPGVTVPGVSVPSVTVPGVSVPSVTVPGVSVPGVTVPAGAAVPDVTAPASTVPGVTLPPLPRGPSLNG